MICYYTSTHIAHLYILQRRQTTNPGNLVGSLAWPRSFLQNGTLLMKLPIIVRTASVVFSRKLLCVNQKTPFIHLRKLRVDTHWRSQTVPAWGSKKHTKKQKIKLQSINIMADPKIEEILAPFRASVKEQVI